MIHVYSDPLLIDFLRICVQMPEDERRQLEAFTGQPYDVDGAAVGNFQVPGPKWVIKSDDTPLVVGGFVEQRPGVWRDYMLTTPAAWTEHWFPITRICRRIMDAMLIGGQAHRLECISHASRAQAHRWYRVLGYEQEACHRGYCANGDDAVVFARVRH